MDKLAFLKLITQLAKYAEEIQDSDPELANDIDSTLSDLAAGQDSVVFNKELFPSIKTPVMPELNSLAKDTANSIINSPDFQSKLDNPTELNDYLNNYFAKQF